MHETPLLHLDTHETGCADVSKTGFPDKRSTCPDQRFLQRAGSLGRDLKDAELAIWGVWRAAHRIHNPLKHWGAITCRPIRAKSAQAAQTGHGTK